MTSIARELRAEGKRIGFVPTMGALHEGHLSLMNPAREMSDVVIASVFVNPAQFGPNEDFEKYPRDLAHDAELAFTKGVDFIFAPAPDDMYPEGFTTYVTVGDLSDKLEGASRPGHFRGVTTVVNKLLNIVEFRVFRSQGCAAGYNHQTNGARACYGCRDSGRAYSQRRRRPGAFVAQCLSVKRRAQGSNSFAPGA
jgi:hypothetical protein